MREIAEQLCGAGNEMEFSRAAGFSENVTFMRVGPAGGIDDTKARHRMPRHFTLNK